MTDSAEQPDGLEEKAPSSVDAALADLKPSLLALDATGETGFEGLLAAAPGELVDIPFRLSASGSQRGVDAASAYDSDSVGFEAKRYDDPIPSDKVLSKLAQLSIGKANLDLWILGASAPVGAQLTEDVRALGDEKGISVLILDWRGPGVTPLAAALALSQTSVVAFLRTQLTGEQTAKARRRRS